MVRVKTRWLLVKLEFKDDVCGKSGDYGNDGDGIKRKKKNTKKNNGISTISTTKECFPTKKDFFIILRSQILKLFGIESTGMILELQVRLCDPTTHLILIRTPRDDYGKVRSAITLLTHMPVMAAIRTSQQSPAQRLSKSGSSSVLPIVASILSVHGCLRTAKIAAIKSIEHVYRHEILKVGNDNNFDDVEEEDDDSSNSSSGDDGRDDYGRSNNKDKNVRLLKIRNKQRRVLIREMDDLLHYVQTME